MIGLIKDGEDEAKYIEIFIIKSAHLKPDRNENLNLEKQPKVVIIRNALNVVNCIVHL